MAEPPAVDNRTRPGRPPPKPWLATPPSAKQGYQGPRGTRRGCTPSRKKAQDAKAQPEARMTDPGVLILGDDLIANGEAEASRRKR